jgi:hypothetical protein
VVALVILKPRLACSSLDRRSPGRSLGRLNANRYPKKAALFCLYLAFDSTLNRRAHSHLSS